MWKVGRKEAATNSRDHGCGLETFGPDRSLGTGTGARSYLQVRDRPGSYLQIVLWVRGRPWIVSPDRTLGPGPAPGRISGSYFCLGFCHKLMKSKVRIGDTICYKVRSGDTIGDPAPDPKYDLGQGLCLARAGGGGEGCGGRGVEWGGVGGCRKAKTTDQDRDLVFVREMPVVKDSSSCH